MYLLYILEFPPRQQSVNLGVVSTRHGASIALATRIKGGVEVLATHAARTVVCVNGEQTASVKTGIHQCHYDTHGAIGSDLARRTTSTSRVIDHRRSGKCSALLGPFCGANSCGATTLRVGCYRVP